MHWEVHLLENTDGSVDKVREKTGMPKLVYENHAMPVFTVVSCTEEGRRKRAYLKLYDGHD